MPGGLKDGAQTTNVVGGYAVYASSDYADRINGDYRYAYNGMEVDNEVSGNGNSYTTKFRQYDSRLGRWKSLDPLAGVFPWHSPYCAFDNNPVFYVDPTGLYSEKGAKKKAKRMRKKGYQNVNIATTFKNGKATDVYGVSTTGKKNGSGTGHYFDNKRKGRAVGGYKFSWNSSKGGYYWGDQNIKDLTIVEREFLKSGNYDSYIKPAPVTIFGKKYNANKYARYSSMEDRLDEMSWDWYRYDVIKTYNEPAVNKLKAAARARITLGFYGGNSASTFLRTAAGGLKIAKIVQREYTYINILEKTNMMRKTTTECGDILFNSGHAYNRAHASGTIAEVGLTMNQVENAIATDLELFVNAGGSIPSTANMIERSIKINGQVIGYKVGMTNDGVIRVSNYWIP